jgi:hypothetical protein
VAIAVFITKLLVEWFTQDVRGEGSINGVVACFKRVVVNNDVSDGRVAINIYYGCLIYFDDNFCLFQSRKIEVVKK